MYKLVKLVYGEDDVLAVYSDDSNIVVHKYPFSVTGLFDCTHTAGVIPKVLPEKQPTEKVEVAF